MTQFVGYIGVLTVQVIEETYFDDGLVLIVGEDPANEVQGWERKLYGVPFLQAWKRAVREIESRNGVVVNRPPRPPRKTKVQVPKIIKVQDDHTRFGVWSAPWDADPIVFKTKRQARRYARKHRREIEANFEY